tara:strand:- start:207 stop:413 length:207 start_codon:yes stop_codon:yes gene_type:complete
MNKIKKKTSSYNMGGSMPMNNNMMGNQQSMDQNPMMKNKKPMAKPGVMTYNLGGMVKSQTNNLKKKTA